MSATRPSEGRKVLVSRMSPSVGNVAAVACDGSGAALVTGAVRTDALAQEAIATGRRDRGASAGRRDLARPLDKGRVTHPGSAAARDAMHARSAGAETLTDSRKMVRMGLAGGVSPTRCGRGGIRIGGTRATSAPPLPRPAVGGARLCRGWQGRARGGRDLPDRQRRPALPDRRALGHEFSGCVTERVKHRSHEAGGLPVIVPVIVPMFSVI